MDNEDYMQAEQVEDILTEHERELFDDQLEDFT